MSKVVRLTENDIEKLVRKIINEDSPSRELERKDTNFRRREFQPYKREKQIQKLFGKYAEDVPPQVIQYLRKIPGTIVKRLVDIYGYERIENYLHKTLGGPLDETYNMDEIISEKNKSNKKLDI